MNGRQMKKFRVDCGADPLEWSSLLGLHISVFNQIENSETDLSIDDSKLIWDSFCKKTGLDTTIDIPRSLRHGNACRIYYELAKGIPNDVNFKEWLKSLPETRAAEFEKRGFEAVKNNLNYLRFVLECQDVSLDDFLKGRLCEEDYINWRQLQKKNSE